MSDTLYTIKDFIEEQLAIHDETLEDVMFCQLTEDELGDPLRLQKIRFFLWTKNNVYKSIEVNGERFLNPYPRNPQSLEENYK